MMPLTRKSSRSSTGSSSEASTVIERTLSGSLPVATLGKRTLSLRSASSQEETVENGALSKKLKIGLSIAEERRNLRKLKNITNTVLTAEVAATVANRKRNRKQDLNEDNGKKKKEEESAVAAAVTESQQKLRESLGKHYFDAGRRLNLDYEPGCLRNVKECADRHANRMKQARRVNLGRQRDTKELLIEARPLQYLEHLEQALLRNEFIDSKLFTKSLELILTINPPSPELNPDYQIPTVLEQAASVLDRTIEQFPPCWLDLRGSYHGIIFGRLEEDCFSRYDRSEGLLKVVLFLLETCVESDPDAGRLLKSSNSNMTSMMATFHQWELEHHQKYDFDLHSRSERFERLFIVLSILVKILELDLAMWILRHPHKTKENMQKDTRKPLLVSVLWNEHSTVGEVNSFVRRIVALYVNVVALRFPEEDVRVMARLLSVIGTTINLSEIQYDGTVDYPCIKDNTRYFVRTISRQLESSPYYGTSLCLRAIDQMRSPLIRMILVDNLLHRFNHQQSDSAGPCAASYMKHLVKGRWRNCAVEDDAVRDEDPVERYPFLDRRRTRKAAHEIGRSQYVNLLLTGFRAYMEVFPVTHYFHSFKQKTAASSSYATRSPSNSPKRLSNEQLRGHRFDFRALEKRIKVLEGQRKRTRPIVRPAAERPVPVDAAAAPLVLEEVNVTPELLVYYRDELKHLLLIQRWLRTKTAAATTEQVEREMFASWRRYLASIDETLACE